MLTIRNWRFHVAPCRPGRRGAPGRVASRARPLAALVLLGGLLAGCGSGPGGKPAPPPSLSLFVTGGLNMQLDPCGCKDRLGGHARRSTVFERFRIAHPDAAVLYLDAGQAFKLDSPELPFAMPAMKEAMTALGLDGMNVGAYELVSGVAPLQDSLEGAGFPLMSGNLRNIDDGRPVLAPYLLLKPRRAAGGALEVPRVGVVGLTVMDRYRVMDGRAGAKTHLIDPLKAAGELLGDVRRQSDIVIVLGNFGRGVARQLSEKHPEIDLIVATDPHIGDEVSEPGVNAPIYFTGLLGKRQLRFDFLPGPAPGRPASGGAGAARPWSVVGHITSINDSLEAEPTALNLLKRYGEAQDAAGFGKGVSVRPGR